MHADGEEGPKRQANYVSRANQGKVSCASGLPGRQCKDQDRPTASAKAELKQQASRV